MMPEFPAGVVTSMEPISAEQLKKEGWGPEGTRDNWGDGPWRNEPDRVLWTEPETGYKCEIKRNRTGSLCGYVMIPDDHIWYGIDYSGCVHKHPPRTREERLTDLREAVAAAERLCEVDPESAQYRSSLRLAKLHLEATETEGSFMWDYKEYPCLSYDREDRCGSPEIHLRVHGGVSRTLVRIRRVVGATASILHIAGITLRAWRPQADGLIQLVLMGLTLIETPTQPLIQSLASSTSMGWMRCIGICPMSRARLRT